jgi:hypothetical protein
MHAEHFSDVAKLYAAGANYVSLPRLSEAVDLFAVMGAVRDNLLEEKSTELKRQLQDRCEVIP